MTFSDDGHLLITTGGGSGGNGNYSKHDVNTGALLNTVAFTFPNVVSSTVKDIDGFVHTLHYTGNSSLLMKWDQDLNAIYSYHSPNNITYGGIVATKNKRVVLAGINVTSNYSPLILFCELIDSMGLLVATGVYNQSAIGVERLYVSSDSASNIYVGMLTNHLPLGYWFRNIGLVKFCIDCYPNTIEGIVIRDNNQHCITDSSDKRLANRMLQVSPADLYTFTDDSGRFAFQLPFGTYDIAHVLPNSYWHYTCDSVYNVVLDSNQSMISGLVFGINANDVDDLSVQVATSAIRPGFTANIAIAYKNNGTTLQNPMVMLKLDTIFTLLSSTQAPEFVSPDSISWNIGTLDSDQSGVIHLHCQVSVFAQLGSFFHLVAYIEPITSDAYKVDNTDTLADIVVGSFDPNDKLIYPLALRLADTLNVTNELTYQIRFQNTGTDTAFTVIIRDEIADYFELGSFQMLAASHPYSIRIINGRMLEWTFNNILLPDSNTNEPASHGFIRYRIKAKTNTNHQPRLIENKAAIYFDYNLPVITNTATIVQRGKEKVDAMDLKRTLRLYPNPASHETFLVYTVTMAGPVSLELFDVIGQRIFIHKIPEQQEGQYNLTLNTENYAAGHYVVRLKSTDGVQTARLVIAR